ncbi:hypothetical protein ACHAPT_005354 [Fusarium lateritium]
MSTTIARSPTPERQRRDNDPVFRTPTSGADLELKMAVLEQRHYGDDWEPSTPKCSADIEEQLAAVKKRQDGFFDDFCFIMRKASRKMDERIVEIKELKKQCAQLEAELEDQEDQEDQVEAVESSVYSRIPVITSLPDKQQSRRGRKRKTTSTSEEKGDEPKTKKKGVDRKGEDMEEAASGN